MKKTTSFKHRGRTEKKYCRILDFDIFGNFALNDRRILNDGQIKEIVPSKTKFFLYFYIFKRILTFAYSLFRTDIPVMHKRRQKNTLSFLMYKNKRIFFTFYLTMTSSQLKRIVKKTFAYKTMLLTNFIMLLEGRADALLYRSLFVTSFFQIRQLIRHNKVLLNFKPIKFPSENIIIGGFISLEPKVKIKQQYQLIFKLKNKLILANSPMYLEVNYKTFIAIFFKKPRPAEVPFPFKVNYEFYRNLLKLK